MSSKGQSSTGSGVGAALAPKRRFPEFRGHPIQDVQLADATIESTERSGSGQTPTQIMGVSKVEGIVPMVEHVIAADTARYKCVRKDWFAYNPMRLNIGSIARWQGDNDILVSPDYVVFECKSTGSHSLNPAYLDHFRRSDIWEEFVSEKGDGGVRVRIYYKDLALLPIALPSFPEQQKIADCLDSADALIVAQGRKVEALRANKKGLLKQIFPQKGETQPRLRFPDFKGAGDWKTFDVSQLAKVTTGSRDTQNKIEGGKYPFFVRSQTVERIDTFALDCEAVLTSGDGVGVGKNFHYVHGKFDFHQRVYCMYEFNERLCGKYFFYFFSEFFGNRVMKMSAKNSVDSVRMAMITEMPISFPSLHEQQRIAECLTSLDDLITAETRKLDKLTTHKKGLMQQLFTEVKESNA